MTSAPSGLPPVSDVIHIPRALEREKQARLHAEKLLEDKSRELYERNRKLRKYNQALKRK